MSARTIYDTALLGSMIRYTNGAPRPPERFRRKVAAWEENNRIGRFVECTPAYDDATCRGAARFTLHIGTYGSHGVTILVVRRVYSVDNTLHFEIVERPKPGMVRVLTSFQRRDELRYLAADAADAGRWLAEHRYPDARCELVGNPDLVERETAA
jgi:hypothetical protein